MALSKKKPTSVAHPRQTTTAHKRAAKSGATARTTGSGSLEKSLNVLEMVISSTPAPSAAQITDTLDLPRPTTNRVISNLVKLDFLKRDARYRQLVPGGRLVDLAMKVIEAATQQGPAHETLRELSAATQETCNIGTIVGGRIRYVDRVESDWPLALRLAPGSEVPMHCTATGKLLLALLPVTPRRQFVNTLSLTAHTERTVTDREVLLKRLDMVAKQGYSLDQEEHLPGVLGIAVPIPGGNDHPVLALGMAVPTARATPESLQKQLPLLREYAERLGECY